jgi:hypothetical protein
MSDDAVIVTTKIGFRPFDVPAFAYMDVPAQPRQEGFSANPRLPLTELDDDVLDALAKRWLDNLFASVSRPSPFRYERPARAA